MNRPHAPYELAVSALVAAAFAAFWVFAFALQEPPEFAVMYLISAIMIALVATPWVFAARLLWRAWWNRRAADLPAQDGPALLLAVAVTAMPEDRRDWGAAMLAELSEVTDRPSRWRFAVGCARTAIFPPSGGTRVLLVGALTAVAVLLASPTVGAALPAMRVFATFFVASVGIIATLAAARSRRHRQSLPCATITLAGLAGVAACIAATAWFLLQNPAAAEHLPPGAAAALALLLSVCLALTLLPPRGLITSRLARFCGIVAASALGLGFLWVSRLSDHTEGGPLVWVLFAPAVIFFVVSAIAASCSGSFRAGVQSAVWTALLGALVTFALSLPEAMRRSAVDGRTLADGETGYAIGANLPSAIWGLVQIPAFGFPFGVIGAACGRRWRRRRSPANRERGQLTDDHANLLRKPPTLGGAT